MKSLLSALFIVAISGSTVHAAAKDIIPVEQKVVEIHMTSKATSLVEESKKKRTGKLQTLPLRGGTCSGSFIDGVGDIITAKHCVEGFDSFEVMTYDQRLYVATVIATSTVHDLAMIHIDRRNTAYFEPAETVTRGEQIFVLGSPLGITDTLSTGVIARFIGDVTLLDCGVLPGNSGGPVFNREGKLVGVVNAGFVVMYGMTHLNIAQSIDAVVFFAREVFEKRYGR